MIRGVSPSPRDSIAVQQLGITFLCLVLLATRTWKRLEARGEGPEAREAHSATLVGKHKLLAAVGKSLVRMMKYSIMIFTYSTQACN
ncbi:unnamed protein product [Eruca vesicaria subsp. sativa]|uniref:Uncharacterized protein n=1 Tax=Eruca vesicaria subsp. sativa TaxID=29727 RepID=A0ABC8LE34_ERUVS|nr:unnamed protein product [Eruca vesicaria subsp. sativa]